MPNETARDLFLRLGYDVHQPADITRLKKNLEFAEARRQSHEKAAKSRSIVLMGIMGAIGTAILAAIMPGAIEWIMIHTHVRPAMK